MLKLIKSMNLKIVLLSACTLLSVNLFAQNNEEKKTESTIVMTEAELESFLSTIADARRTQLRERDKKRKTDDLANLRLKYNARQQQNNYGYEGVSNQQILMELRYLNQRIDNLSSNNTIGSTMGRDNSTILMPGHSSQSSIAPPLDRNTTTLLPQASNQDKIDALQSKIDSLKNVDQSEKMAIQSSTVSDSLNTMSMNLQAIRKQMEDLESKLMGKDNPSKGDVSPENRSYFKQEVYFDNNSDKLSESFNANIKQLSDILEKYPDAKILLEGWASPVGNSNYNKQLSMRRSESVAKAFEKYGINPDRVLTAFKGEDTKSSEAKARRVDMAIIVR